MTDLEELDVLFYAICVTRQWMMCTLRLKTEEWKMGLRSQQLFVYIYTEEEEYAC